MSFVKNMELRLSHLVLLLGLTLFCQNLSAQSNGSASGSPTSKIQTPVTIAGPRPAESEASNSQNWVAPLISPGDEVDVTVYDAPDLSVHRRVGGDGDVSMPIIGQVHLAGLSSREAEQAIKSQLLRSSVVNYPQVSVYVKEYGSSGISVAGEVAKPGVYSVLGPHRLFDILQSAGGLTERAADQVIICHRGSNESVTIDLPRDPEQLSRLNVVLLPGDTLVVPKAGVVYVLGAITKPGGYVLSAAGGITLLRIIAAAGGPTQAAGVGGTKMLRRTPEGLHELPVPLKKLLHAKVPDISVQADDIIYIPNSHMKQLINAGALLTAAASVGIYRVP